MAPAPRAPSTPSRSVSRTESAVTLPEIPLLAPLEPIPVPRQRTDDPLLANSPLTPHDSFMTALTSPSSSSTHSHNTFIPHLSSSHSLRKSISVDSFIKNTRSTEMSDPGPSSSVQLEDHTSDSDFRADQSVQAWNATASNPTAEVLPRMIPSKTFASRILGRSRGHSLSGLSVTEYDDPYLDDSENERTVDMAHLPLLPPHRTRSASSPHVNGHGKAKRPHTGDVLLLPPRPQTLSNASSASSLSSVNNGTQFPDTIPPVPPIPQLHQRRPHPGPLVMPQRNRSGSFSAFREIQCELGADISIAVVGTLGCGKSTLVRKGLKNWGLSDESICSVATSKGGLRYTLRSISIPPGQQSARLANVVELDSDTLHLETPEGAWPKGLPHIDGVLVCYDASDLSSFARVPDLLSCYQALHLSAVAIACKSDLEKKVPPHWASDRATQYNVGLVEVSSASDTGKKKMRHCFSWLLRAVAQAKRDEHRAGSPYRNPASPDVLTAPWADGFSETRTGSVRSYGSTPSAGSPKFREHPLSMAAHMAAVPQGGASTPTPRPPSAPTSPTRVRSASDLLTEMERGKKESAENIRGRVLSLGAGSSHETQETHEVDQSIDINLNDGIGIRKESRAKDSEPPPMPWATTEELLDKLFFLAVSGDDTSFIDHFFLTYRRFATPRTVLLNMQKRIRQLHTEETLLGSYAQMRMCDLLVEWVEHYPNDFATPGASGALTALLMQLMSNSSTMHYGSDILPFLEDLHHLRDIDGSWSMRIDEPRDESDDDGGAQSADDDVFKSTMQHSAIVAPLVEESVMEAKPKIAPVVTRERKGSVSSKSFLSNTLTVAASGSSENSRISVKNFSMSKASVKDLLKVSQALSQCDLKEVAQEITRQQSELFMSIEPRQWLRYTMGNSRLETDKEPISGSATFYNRLSTWVTSLILAHDRIKGRSRQVERFSELAGVLRHLNNYAGLRAVMTGINNATYPNDEVMMLFMQNKREEYKSYLSYEVLLNSTRNHRAYRMALKHTTGAAIPDMEVHTFDMVRAHESNDDFRSNDPDKIHWGKFTLMARMITTLHGFQKKIISTHTYNFPERPHIKRLMNEAGLMDEDMQRTRVIPPPDNSFEVPYATALGIDAQALGKDVTRFKRLFFW